MSAVVEAVSDVGEFVGDAVESVGDIASDAVREVGKGAESLGREIGKVGQAAINDPVGTIAKVAAIATQQYWALPLISATTVIANGGDLGQAALSAGISYAGMYIASGISDYLASGAESSLMGVENLSDGSSLFSYSDGSTMLQTADGLTKFTAPTTITGALNTAISNAAGNVATTALRGGDLNEILMSGLTGGAGTYVNIEATQGLKDLGLAAPIANVLGTTSGAVTRGVISGQDAGEVFNTALINNIISTSLAQTGSAIKNTDIYKGLQKSVNETINEFKDSFNSSKQKFLDELNKNDDLTAKSKEQISEILEQSKTLQSEADNYRNNTLTPAQEIAQKAYETTKSSYEVYKQNSDEFSKLVTEYDEAKAAGNTELANSLADKANALIPTLNAATDKYNADYGVYESAKNDFETKNQTYTGYVDKFKELDTQYSNINKQLQNQNEITKQASNEFNTVYDKIQENASNVAKQVDGAYEKASTYDSIAKDTFKDIYLETGDLTRAVNLSEQVNSLPEDNQRMYEFAKTFGLRPEDAIEFAPDLSKMSLVAAQTFYDSLAQNPDAASAFNTASKINSLSDAEQDSFYNAKLKGLDNDQALNVASVVGGQSKEQQQLYIDSIQSGLGPQFADILTAAYGLTSRGTQLQDINEANLAKLETPEQKQAYNIAVASGMRPKDAFESVLDFFVPSAQASTLPYVGKTPDGKDLVEGVYKQDPTTSKWGEYIPDGKGGYTNTGKLLVGNYTEGPSGSRYVIDKTVDENGVPGMSMMPYKGEVEPSAPGQFQSTKAQLDAELAEGQITKAEYDEAMKNVVPGGTISGGTTPTAPVSPTIQNWIDELFTGPKAAKKLATTTGTGTGTGTGTTGSATTGGPTTGGTGTGGTGTGTGTGGGTQPGTGGGGGTEPGTGGTGGTEPGTGGGGTGTGGTGTGGTGTGGTGTGGTGGGGFGIGGIGGGGFTIPGSMYGMYGLYGQNEYGGIKNLTAGLTEKMDYNLSGLPSDQDMVNPMYNAPQIIPQMAAGGSTYDPFSTKDTAGGSGISGALTPSLTKAQLNYVLTGLPDYLQGRAEGGHIEGHNPQFYSEGGLNSLENRYVKGDGDGTSDDVPAMLANGEFVIPADVVSKLGNGSNDAGASVLDQFLQVIRKHAQNHDPKKLPPDSKGPLAYLIDAQRRAKA